MHTGTEQEMLLKAIDAFRNKLIVVSPDYRILAWRRHRDAPPEGDGVGQLCYQVLHGRCEPCGHCAVKTVLETHQPAWSPRDEDLLSDEAVPCHYAYPIFSGDEIEAVVSMEMELPARSQIEEKLQRSNAFLRNLITSAVDGVMAADKKGKIIIYNDTAQEIFGYSVQEALATLDIRAIYPAGIEREVMRQLRSEAHGGRGKLRSYLVDVLHRDGTRIPINLNAAIIYEGDREVATIGFFHDMRATLHMNKVLEKVQVQLMQSEKMASLGKLAAGVAHQLNNPLGGVTLYTRLVLEDYELPAGARDDLGRVLRDAERCRETVKELLEFTRQTRHLMQPHDINQAISRTLFLLKNQPLFQNVTIETHIDGSLPPVHSDVQQINHLFMNLILNAAQAMGGCGRLVIRTARAPGAADQVHIEISDTGPGIAADVLPHIFEPFFTTKPEGEGTGLGLSMVYGIVENHGGQIRATSTPGEGATFIIQLPITTNSDGERNSGNDTSCSSADLSGR